MKYSAVFLASFMLGQSAMATNIYHPPSVGHIQVRAPNGTEPYASGSGAAPKPTKKCSSTGKASATIKPTVLPSSSKKPCKPKSSSASVATSAVAVTSDAPATTAGPSTVYHTTTIIGHTSETVIITVTPSAATSTSAAALTSLNVQVPGSSSFSESAPAPATSSKAANSVPPYPTTLATSVASTIASTGFATGTGAAYPSGTGSVKEYYRCGGIGYTGPTACVEGTVCKVQNPYYSQCVAKEFA
ncbi:Glycoside hydrolase superfamily protein [Rutstroemia sp. NJR-2017a BVV2]|nr:Glycoside hydrolase superfamily protein [Rutstroemia sp. NJR-2017a BVV2]